MMRSELEVIGALLEEFCRKGKIVKVLDESGEPLRRKGQQVYKKMEGATAAERAFWNKENKVNGK